MSILGLGLSYQSGPLASPNLNAAPAISAVTLYFDIPGDAAPAVSFVTLQFDVVV